MRAMLCSPDYIAIHREINTYMHRDDPPDPIIARQEWQKLLKIYLDLGVEVWFMDPDPDLQDMCFAANFAWCRWGKVILSNFAHAERIPEKVHCQIWFNTHRQKMLDVEVHELPQTRRFEGQGDTVAVDTPDQLLVLMGYGQGRTDYETAPYLAEIHHLDSDQVIPMRLVLPEFYHLDMASNYIEPRNLFVFHPGAFDSAGKRIIDSLPAELFPVSEKDANNFVCNGVFVEHPVGGGKSEVVYITSKPSRSFRRTMEDRYGIPVIQTSATQVNKNGGDVRCLTLFLPEEGARREANVR